MAILSWIARTSPTPMPTSKDMMTGRASEAQWLSNFEVLRGGKPLQPLAEEREEPQEAPLLFKEAGEEDVEAEKGGPLLLTDTKQSSTTM